MKAYLLYPQQDFDFAGDLPPTTRTWSRTWS